VWDVFPRVLRADGRALQVYLTLLDKSRAAEEALAEEARIEAGELSEILAELAASGLVAAIDDAAGTRWEARPPVDRVDDLLDQGWKSLDQFIETVRAQHRQTRELTEHYWMARSHSDSYPGIEVIHDRGVVHQQFLLIEENARHEIRAFDRPPYSSDGHQDRFDEQEDLQKQRMAAGVSYKVIYEADWSDRQDHRVTTLEHIFKGEQARMMPHLPMKLVIGDDDRALVTLDPAYHADTTTLLIYPSGLLRALIDVFEQFWGIAMPLGNTSVPAKENGELDRRQRGILTLLSAGASDDVIARRLGVSRRTVARELIALQDHLRASSRFQIGAQAVRLGYI
jgi:DNA-binding CsgD family transcriptional regulator